MYGPSWEEGDLVRLDLVGKTFLMPLLAKSPVYVDIGADDFLLNLVPNPNGAAEGARATLVS